MNVDFEYVKIPPRTSSVLHRLLSVQKY